MHAYDNKDLKRLFGLPATSVRALTRSGHINPVNLAGRLHYSFEDLVLLRTASALRAAKIPTRRINRTLSQMRTALPAGEALRMLSLSALGDRITVRQGKMRWESDTGQYVLGLEFDEQSGTVHLINRTAPAEPDPVSSDDHYAQAYELEERDRDAAIDAYRACLVADPAYVDARINLGRLLHKASRLDEAEQVYLADQTKDPLIQFNLGVLFEDLQRNDEALDRYKAAVLLDPHMADAHFNIARLYELKDRSQESLRHLNAYRRLRE